MSDVVTRVENLGKKYRIQHQRERQQYVALRDVLTDRFLAPWRWLREQRAGSNGNGASPRAAGWRLRTEDFWALKDVSLEIRQGEVVGIIGRNGAGKSTLLKILSRITEPTEGRVRIRGRVASLLEVGTGFHPELTGRENIFLNGAILGMTKAEIKRKFDDIVAFAEIEKFLDTPVKRYSSGMYVRLAFAIAAHLDPEILVVDEVLAVGDAEFQKKCLGKMGDVASHGRTVLFVSHDMGNVTRLCRRGILLDEGRVRLDGEITAVAARYLTEHIAEEGYADLGGRGDRSGSAAAQWQSIELLKGSNRRSAFAFGDSLTIRTGVEVRSHIWNAQLAVIISTDDGVPVHGLESINEGMSWSAEAGDYLFEITIPKLQLFPGGYVIDLWIGNGVSDRVDYLKGAISFQVVQSQDSGLAGPLQRCNGLVFTPSQWSHGRIR
jgi:lipopolysaccharide transport system ATP-binding protein